MFNTISVTSTGVITTLNVNVERIVWAGAGAVTDVCTIKDNNNRFVFNAISGLSQYNLEEKFDKPVSFQGLNVTAISSGTLTVYYK